MPTFNTTDPKPGYVYDSDTDTWFPLLGIATQSLDGLTDVIITSPVTNQVLAYNGTNWVNSSEAGDVSAVTAGTGITVTNGTGPIPTIAIDTTTTVDTSTAQTLTNKTITTPTLTLSSTSSTTSGRISFNATEDKIVVGDGTNAVEFAPSTLLFNAQTGTTYTFALTDKDRLVTASTSATQTYSIPTNASVAFPIGTQINIIQIGAGQVTIQAATPATTTVNSTGATSTAPKLRAQYSSATLIKAGTDLWYVVGDIS